MSEVEPMCVRELAVAVHHKTEQTLPGEMAEAVEASTVADMPVIGVEGVQTRRVLVCRVGGCAASCLLDRYSDSSLKAHRIELYGEDVLVSKVICSKFQALRQALSARY